MPCLTATLYTQYGTKFFGRHEQVSGRGRGSGRGLREGGRPRGAEGDMAFDLLHQLMDMAVEHGDRAEPLEKSECAGRILRAQPQSA